MKVAVLIVTKSCTLIKITFYHSGRTTASDKLQADIVVHGVIGRETRPRRPLTLSPGMAPCTAIETSWAYALLVIARSRQRCLPQPLNVRKGSNMTPVQDAPIHRRRLRSELRRVRKGAGFTQRDVAEAMEWSLSKLIRTESGSVGISTSDLKVLLQHYGVVDPAEVERFLSLARAGKEQRGWWTEYRELAPHQYLTLLGYESSASVIQTLQPLVIPGLLQDEEYARAIIRAVSGSATDKLVEELVKL